MAAQEYSETQRLELDTALGFSGKVPGGLLAHPNGVHLVYPLGACIVIREIGNPRSSDFLYGHNDKISCIAVSPTGRYIASGQVTHPGFQADVCIFDFEQRKLIHRMLLHKVKVQALSFSHDERFLASIGGEDDNTVVVWDVDTGRPVCGAPAHHTESSAVAFFRTDSTRLITGGTGSLRVWDVDTETRRMAAEDVNMGSMRRAITTIAVEASDTYAYCGTTTGDVICVQIKGRSNTFKMQGPQKKMSGGIASTIFNQQGDLLVGSGAGEVQLLSKINLTVQREATVLGAATGLALAGPHYFVGTDSGNIYFINGNNFCTDLRITCHSDSINDIVFPDGFSAVFATCSGSDIRVWNAKTFSELLRIEIPGRTCNCIQFTKDGSLILSGWSDGRLRGFGPQSGKLVVSVSDAHKTDAAGKHPRAGGHLGVTAIATCRTPDRFISGGSDGLVRVWTLRGKSCDLVATMKEHNSTINAITISQDDTECFSVSDDGSCIAWDLTRHIRRNIMFSQSYLRAVEYFPDESQVLTCGSDKVIAYWDAVECSAIREVAGSKTGELFGLSISPDGAFFATGGGDRILKVWDYDRGDCVAVGLAHSCGITKVRVSPDGKRIVSVGDEGAIMVWTVGSLPIEPI